MRIVSPDHTRYTYCATTPLSKGQLCDNHYRIVLQSTQKVRPTYSAHYLKGHLQQYKAYYLLDRIIFQCYLKHRGGEAFFEELDIEVRDKSITNLLVKRGLLNHEDIVVSGKFGIFFHSVYKSIFRNIIVVDGGLRKAEKELWLDIPCDSIRGRDFAFVDDSFYSGITRGKITAEIRRLGGDIKQSFVIYDGSKTKDNSVTSIYRYYD